MLFLHSSERCIGPKGFEAVELPGFRLEDVYKNVTVVDDDPLAALHADGAECLLAGVVSDIVHQPVGDTVDVCRGGAFANNKIGSRGLFDIGHIYDADVFGFSLLKPLHYNFN